MISNKIQDLRKIINFHDAKGIVIPKTDQFQGEYIDPYYNRLEFISGFSGSFGLAIITLEKSFLFVDSRYTIQAKLEAQNFETIDYTQNNFKKWSLENLNENDCLILDPWLVTIDEWQNFAKIFKNLKAIESRDTIDTIWENRPNLLPSKIQNHDLIYAGVTALEKLEKFKKFLKDNILDYFLITSPENICWLLNIRAEDVPFTPLLNAFLVVRKDDLNLFVKNGSNHIPIKDLENLHYHSLNDFCNFLQNVPNDVNFGLDSKQTPKICESYLKHTKLFFVDNPCKNWQSIKNITEQNGAYKAHIDDAVALCEFFSWFDDEYSKGSKITEIEASDKLSEFRKQNKNFRYESFASISAFGSNGAIVHYKPSPKTNKLISDGIYLIDSGGQYPYGTTDVTRVIACGNNFTFEQKQIYTRVLKGNIALSKAVFPDCSTGKQLDVLARQFLWEAGLDYGHGTGHGVGSFLSVHEGMQGISPRNDTPLKEGMIISNEPGFYKENEFGIRIENLLLIKKAKNLDKMLCFDTLTLVPFENKLILSDMLTNQEINWIKNYYQKIYDNIFDKLTLNAKKWLQKNLSI